MEQKKLKAEDVKRPASGGISLLDKLAVEVGDPNSFQDEIHTEEKGQQEKGQQEWPTHPENPLPPQIRDITEFGNVLIVVDLELGKSYLVSHSFLAGIMYDGFMPETEMEWDVVRGIVKNYFIDNKEI